MVSFKKNVHEMAAVYGEGCMEAASLSATLDALGISPERRFPDNAATQVKVELGELWLLTFDLRTSMDRVFELQQIVLAGGANALLIALAPGTVHVGPLARPNEASCIRCWNQWRRNNHSTPDVTGSNRLLKPQTPVSEPVSMLVRHIIAATLADYRSIHSLVGSSLRIRLDSMEVQRHRFLPDSTCPHCAKKAEDTSESAVIEFQPSLRKQSTDKRPENPLLSLSALRDRFVDRHTGMIMHVFQDMASTMMPMVTAEMPIMGSEGFEFGYGRTEDALGSELVAILEAVERYCGHKPREKSSGPRGSVRAISERFPDYFIDPAAFTLHDDESVANQLFELLPYHTDLAFNWCWGFSLRRREPILVPEQLVYYRLEDEEGRSVNRFIYDSSNGCALGGSHAEAILSGLYEVVERDAYFTTWYSRIAPLQIANKSIKDHRCQALIARAEAEGFEVHLFDMTFDIAIPSVWGMIVDPADDANVKSYCASAAGGRWDEAIFAALVEITTSMGVYRKSMPEHRSRAYKLLHDDSLVQDMTDHVLVYSVPKSYERLSFLFTGQQMDLEECKMRVPEMDELDLTCELEHQLNKVLSVAEDVIVVDQTISQLDSLGLKCVKVLVPGLMPVTFGHQYRRINYERLAKAAAARGASSMTFDATTINPFPHNFP